MTIQTLKRNIARLLTAGVLAGAVALAIPTKADAQVPVFTGRPYPVYPIAAGNRFRAVEFRRHETWRDRRFNVRFNGRFDHRYYGRYDHRYYGHHDRRFYR